MSDTNQPPADDQSATDELAAAQAEIAQLKEQLAARQAEAPEALKELAARAQADLQNAKERLEREAQDIRKFAVANFVMTLLPTIDNFQRAFATLPEELKGHQWISGVEAMEKDLLKILRDAGLTKIDALHQPVDPEKHEVLQLGPGPADTVIEIFENGYQLHDRVLRPAKVKAGDGATS